MQCSFHLSFTDLSSYHYCVIVSSNRMHVNENGGQEPVFQGSSQPLRSVIQAFIGWIMTEDQGFC